MYEEVFEEFQLTVVELPIEFVDDLPVYRGHLKELTFLSAEASSRKKLYQQLLQAYLLYREENQAVVRSTHARHRWNVPRPILTAIATAPHEGDAFSSVKQVSPR